MFRHFLRISILLILPLTGLAQRDSLYEIKGLPTKQLYDLKFDSRDLLWIGHELGLARYDGINITKFSCPEMNSTGLSNIIEDRQGRIWCRNFTSQVFFVENEKMHLLDSYQYANEPRFPQMTIIGDYLICTSKKGLFVLNTSTFRYHIVNCGNLTPTSFSVMDNRLIVYASFHFFEFSPLKDVQHVKELKFKTIGKGPEHIVLQDQVFNDTMYSFSAIRKSIDKLYIYDNEVKIIGTIPNNGLFNTLSFSGAAYWLNTTSESHTLDGTQSINGYSLTDIVLDKEGNTWLSSWMSGLYVKYQSYWKRFSLPFIDPGENVTRIEKNGTYNVYATTGPNVIVENEQTKKILKKFPVPKDGSSIHYMKFIDSTRVIFTTALTMYLLDLKKMAIENLSRNYIYFSMKSAARADSSIFVAAATGLYEHRDLPGHEYSFKQLTSMRSKWVEYSTQHHKLLVAFKDGLFYMKDSIPVPILYNNKLLPAVTLLQAGSGIYISSIGGEMYKWDGSTISRLNLVSEYRSSPINSLKSYHDTLWLLGADFMKLVDIHTDKPIPTPIPSFPDAKILDMSWYNGKIVLLTNKGMYRLVSDKLTQNYQLKNVLLKISINGNDTLTTGDLKLSHNNNSLAFYLSAPFYTNSEKIYFKYRLLGSGNDEWMDGENGVTSFLFSSLKPGEYTFEALAVHTQFGAASQPVTVSFTILPVWYETNLFKLFFSLLIASAIILPMGMYFRSRLKQQRTNYEKQLAIQLERERISEELHDDIGAGLSGARLLTELTANKFNTPDIKLSLGMIYNSITELSSKMQEVIWSLNSSNDSLDNLLRYIQRQALKLLEHSGIHLVVNMPSHVPPVEMGSEMRTDIYLSVKEALHNALKHSDATEVVLTFIVENNLLMITVSDNGNGIIGGNPGGNGFVNMKKRIVRLKGEMEIQDMNGVLVSFSIPYRS